MVPTRIGGILPEEIFRFLLEREIKRALRDEYYFSLMMVRLEGDDQHDHLLAAMERVRNQMRESDDRGLLGASKAAALFPSAENESLYQIISRIAPLILNDSRCADMLPCHYRIAIGGASFPMDGTTAGDLIDAAERSCN